MLRDLIERVGFEIFPSFGKVESRFDPVLAEIRFFESFETGRDCLVRENENGSRIFLRDAAGLQCGVEAVFHVLRCEHHAGRVTVRAVDRLHEVGLLYRGRKTGRRAASLDVDHDEWHLGHACVTDSFGLECEAGAGGAGDGKVT